MNSKHDVTELVTLKGAAKLFQASFAMVKGWSKQGNFPKHHTVINGKKYWHRLVLLGFAKRQRDEAEKRRKRMLTAHLVKAAVK